LSKNPKHLQISAQFKKIDLIRQVKYFSKLLLVAPGRLTRRVNRQEARRRRNDAAISPFTINGFNIEI